MINDHFTQKFEVRISVCNIYNQFLPKRINDEGSHSCHLREGYVYLHQKVVNAFFNDFKFYTEFSLYQKNDQHNHNE